MPPKRRPRKNKGSVAEVKRESSLVGTFHETKATLPPSFDPLQYLAMMKQGVPPSKVSAHFGLDSFEVIDSPAKAEGKESKKLIDEAGLGEALLKNMVRTMFKSDHPFRTKVNIHGTLATSAAGVLNNTFPTTSISSCAEWSSAIALFDEFFIHSFVIRFFPYNAVGGGISTAGVAGTLTNASPGTVTSCGIILASLYSNAPTYSTAQTMGNNPSKAYQMSNKAWRYFWRNNVRFDARGPIDNSSGAQGWMTTGSVSSYGGQMQIRTVNDTVLGDATHAVVLGNVSYEYDVSFRSRA